MEGAVVWPPSGPSILSQGTEGRWGQGTLGHEKEP